jgi:A/G-specific adenine glycosylase
MNFHPGEILHDDFLLFIIESMQTKRLETWFLKHQRQLPFRQNPTPYGIWVSEVMLQQTQMETVLRYYPSFIKRFPTIDSLAKATQEEVLTEVQGLGYYRRFRLLHQGSQYILEKHHGRFPNRYEDVINIPGVGAYTAGAIMAIAFNQPYPATDGNVIRVLSRWYGKKEDMRLASSRKVIDALHGQLVQQANPKVYIQAVMELGALVCRPVQPRCNVCPLQPSCVAHQTKQTDLIPFLSKIKTNKNREWQTLVMVKDKHLLMIKNKTELLKDMYLLPQWEASIDVVENLLHTNRLKPISFIKSKLYKHVFTHQTWLMDVYQMKIKEGALKEGVWIHEDELNQIPIPEAHQKIIRDFFPQYHKTKLYNKKED